MQIRTGVAAILISAVISAAATSGSAMAAEQRVQCTFDRMTGFNALDGKVERTRADTIERWTVFDDAAAETARPEGGGDQSGEVVRLNKPATLNWIQVDEAGDITMTTVYKQVRRGPDRYLAIQTRTAPVSVAGARPAIWVGTCKTEQSF